MNRDEGRLILIKVAEARSHIVVKYLGKCIMNRRIASVTWNVVARRLVRTLRSPPILVSSTVDELCLHKIRTVDRGNSLQGYATALLTLNLVSLHLFYTGRLNVCPVQWGWQAEARRSAG